MKTTESCLEMKGSAVRFAIVLMALFSFSFSVPAGPLVNSRLRVDAKINGKPVLLAFDTGADMSVLFRPAAERLGLRIAPPPDDAHAPPGQVLAGRTETLDLALWGQIIRCDMAVIDTPEGIREDISGVLGWSSLRKNIVRIDAENMRFEFLDKVPASAGKWLKFPLRRDTGILAMILPDRETGRKYVELDTGADDTGAALCDAKWNKWNATHRDSPRTLRAFYMPGSGLVIDELMWADRITLGPLTLTNISIEKGDVTENGISGPGFLASLGIDAMKGMDIIADGKRNFIYIHQKQKFLLPDHNRIGAVFTPISLDADDLYLLAHVLPGSPAWDAGIRDGDVLLTLDGLDATHWRTNTLVIPMSPFWERPAGTKTRLKIKRGDEVFETTVTLREIIGPGATIGLQKSTKLPGQ